MVDWQLVQTHLKDTLYPQMQVYLEILRDAARRLPEYQQSPRLLERLRWAGNSYLTMFKPFKALADAVGFSHSLSYDITEMDLGNRGQLVFFMLGAERIDPSIKLPGGGGPSFLERMSKEEFAEQFNL